MRKFIVPVICMLAVALKLNAQGKGIHFYNGNWQEIINKAKAEHKKIFIDCYASWCGPCKKMDNTVYSDSIVGEYFNANFISVKLQIDSTNKDDDVVKKNYKLANFIRFKYSINAFPSYLFFSENGVALHRGLGFKDSIGLVNLAIEALDSSRQYYTKIREFDKGILTIDQMPDLIKQANRFGNKDLVNKLGITFKTLYIDKLGNTELLRGKSFDFLSSNPDFIKSNERFFYFLYEKSELLDSTRIDRDRIKWLIDYVITKEEITDKLWENDVPITPRPNWNAIFKTIESKYNKSFAERLIPSQKLLFYQKTKDWKEYSKLIDHNISINPPQKGNQKDSWSLNDNAWVLFVFCDDDVPLKRALEWSTKSIQNVGDSCRDVSNFYDTRANLLYKLGKNRDAIKCEEMAILLARITKSWLEPSFIETKQKMEKGIPTWK